MMKIPFNRPVYLPQSLKFIKNIIRADKQINIAGDGYYGHLCENELKKIFGTDVLLTTSCTHALEMAAFLIDVRPGDEIILPSFTYVSTALAFENRGAALKFIDVDSKTGNILVEDFKQNITNKTKAVITVHYAGNSTDMDELIAICKSKKIILIEDAAQAFGTKYKNKLLGTFGDLATLSFHETKNITSGEGGALIINNKKYLERAKIIRDVGTNRAQYNEGLVNQYCWVDIGSSYVLSDLNAAYLYPQIKKYKKINDKRLAIVKRYSQKIKLKDPSYFIQTPLYNQSNGHMCAVVCSNNRQRQAFIRFMKKNGVMTPFHYVSLHSSPYIKKMYHRKDHLPDTDLLSKCLVRLPLYYDLKQKQVNRVIYLVNKFFSG